MIKISNDQEMAQSERNFHSKKRGGKNLNKQSGTKIYRKPSEQLFSQTETLSYPKLTKNMKTYIRCKQHKKTTPKYKTVNKNKHMSIAVSPWNDQ